MKLLLLCIGKEVMLFCGTFCCSALLMERLADLSSIWLRVCSREPEWFEETLLVLLIWIFWGRK